MTDNLNNIEPDQSKWDFVDRQTVLNTMMAGQYLVLDLQKPTEMIVPLPLNGRQGDDGLTQKIWLKNGSRPYDLRNQQVQLLAQDPADKVKMITNVIGAEDDLQYGKFTMLLPRQMFYSAGVYKKMWLQVIDSTSTIISTINLGMEVYAGVPTLTFNDEDYIDKVTATLQNALKTINDYQDNINTTMTGVDTRIKGAQDQVTGLLAQVSSGQVPTKDQLDKIAADLASFKTTVLLNNGNQTFNGVLTFTNTPSINGQPVATSGNGAGAITQWLGSMTGTLNYRYVIMSGMQLVWLHGNLSGGNSSNDGFTLPAEINITDFFETTTSHGEVLHYDSNRHAFTLNGLVSGETTVQPTLIDLSWIAYAPKGEN